MNVGITHLTIIQVGPPENRCRKENLNPILTVVSAIAKAFLLDARNTESPPPYRKIRNVSGATEPAR